MVRGELEVPLVVACKHGHPDFIRPDRFHPHHLEVIRVPPLCYVSMGHAPYTLCVAVRPREQLEDKILHAFNGTNRTIRSINTQSDPAYG